MFPKSLVLQESLFPTDKKANRLTDPFKFDPIKQDRQTDRQDVQTAYLLPSWVGRYHSQSLAPTSYRYSQSHRRELARSYFWLTRFVRCELQSKITWPYKAKGSFFLFPLLKLLHEQGKAKSSRIIIQMFWAQACSFFHLKTLDNKETRDNIQRNASFWKAVSSGCLFVSSVSTVPPYSLFISIVICAAHT